LPNGHLTEDTAMRSAHDWGRAHGRPCRSATVSRWPFHTFAFAMAGVAMLAACDGSTPPPTNAIVNGDTHARESIRSEIGGVVYPVVAIQPNTTTMSLGQTIRFQAHLSDQNGSWTSCCTTWKSSDPTVISVTTTGY